MSSPLLSVEHLTVELDLGGDTRTVLRDVTLSVGVGEILGLVGESGSGKSMTARAVGRLLPAAAQAKGRVRFGEQDVLALEREPLRQYRAGSVAMIFQDPRAAINPVRSIGDFVTEGMRQHRRLTYAEACERACDLLEVVGVNDPERRLRQYPHELSGGLLQRIMIAAALSAEPQLLLADEPTTALDVTTQAEVMAILDELRVSRDLSILMITHDLELAAAVCDRISVMYAGEIVESQDSAPLTESPRHPYTDGLLAARPRVDVTQTHLKAIQGRPTTAFEAGQGCGFSERCPYAIPRCDVEHPELISIDDLQTRCLRDDEFRSGVPREELVTHEF